MNLKNQSNRKQKRRGVLTFEWLLLATLLVIGIVGGVAAIRDTAVVKFIQTGGAIGNLDLSYTVHATSEDYVLKHSTVSAVQMTNDSKPCKIEVKTYNGG